MMGHGAVLSISSKQKIDALTLTNEGLFQQKLEQLKKEQEDQIQQIRAKFKAPMEALENMCSLSHTLNYKINELQEWGVSNKKVYSTIEAKLKFNAKRPSKQSLVKKSNNSIYSSQRGIMKEPILSNNNKPRLTRKETQKKLDKFTSGNLISKAERVPSTKLDFRSDFGAEHRSIHTEIKNGIESFGVKSSKHSEVPKISFTGIRSKPRLTVNLWKASNYINK